MQPTEQLINPGAASGSRVPSETQLREGPQWDPSRQLPTQETPGTVQSLQHLGFLIDGIQAGYVHRGVRQLTIYVDTGDREHMQARIADLSLDELSQVLLDALGNSLTTGLANHGSGSDDGDLFFREAFEDVAFFEITEAPEINPAFEAFPDFLDIILLVLQ